MSVRIQTGGLASHAAQETKGAEPLSESSARHWSGVGLKSGSDDHVELSPLSAAMSAAADAHQPEQADRVRTIGAVYQSGRYQIDSAKLAKAIVSEALSAAGVETAQ